MRRSCATALVTPSRTSTSVWRGVPSPSNGRPGAGSPRLPSGSSTMVTDGSNCSAPSSANDCRWLNSLPLKPKNARLPRMSATASGSSTTSYRPGGSSIGSAGGPGLGRRPRAQHRAVDVAEPAAGQPGHAVRAVDAGDAVHRGLGRAALDGVPVAVREGGRGVHRAAEAGRLQPAGRADEIADPRGPLARIGPRGRLVEAEVEPRVLARAGVTGRDRQRRGRGQARPGRVGRAQPGRLDRAVDQRAQTVRRGDRGGAGRAAAVQVQP